MLVNSYTVRRRGENHPLYSEDFLYLHETDQFIYGAVFDGCSSGTDAHFSSSLLGKCLKKVLVFNTSPQLGDGSLRQHTYNVLHQVFSNLLFVISTLKLSWEELLSTFLLVVYSKEKDEAIIIIMGDGVVAINSEIFIIDQNNAPDYPIYFLNQLQADDFSSWIEKIATIYHASNPQNIAISTDGILSFRAFAEEQIKTNSYMADISGIVHRLKASDTDIPQLLMAGPINGSASASPLFTIVENLLHQKNLIVIDDLSVIRLTT
jgi:hypothetical protein